MAWPSWTIALALVTVVMAVGVGRFRHDPSATIVLNALGFPLLLIGLGVAIEVSPQAFWAAAAASLGSLLFTTADQHRRTPRPGPPGL